VNDEMPTARSIHAPKTFKLIFDQRNDRIDNECPTGQHQSTELVYKRLSGTGWKKDQTIATQQKLAQSVELALAEFPFGEDKLKNALQRLI
jgi:hypothetical protein